MFYGTGRVPFHWHRLIDNLRSLLSWYCIGLLSLAAKNVARCVTVERLSLQSLRQQ